MMIAPSCQHDQTRKDGKDRNGNQRHKCCLCGKRWTEERPKLIGDMRIDLALAESILKHLCEGTSVRATSRLTNVCKQTVLDLLMLVGGRCGRWMQLNLRGVTVEDIQVDEVWQFIYCKEKTAKQKRLGSAVGDSYCFTAIERNTKLMVAWHFGKRDQYNTDAFCAKLAYATSGRFQISSDGFQPYLSAVVRHLGHRVEHGVLVKIYGAPSIDEQRRYSPAKIKSVKKEAAFNLPDMKRVCTSHVERQNLNFRTFMRRMTRLSEHP